MADVRRTGGFTLIEVLVALAIAAVALAAVTAAISQMVDGANSIQRRTYANWIGHNRVAELRLANVIPDLRTTTGEVTYAGQEWRWETTVSETGVDNLFRVDVNVGLAGADVFLGQVTGFIGEPVSPGDGNRAWSTQVSGETI